MDVSLDIMVVKFGCKMRPSENHHKMEQSQNLEEPSRPGTVSQSSTQGGDKRSLGLVPDLGQPKRSHITGFSPLRRAHLLSPERLIGTPRLSGSPERRRQIEQIERSHFSPHKLDFNNAIIEQINLGKGKQSPQVVNVDDIVLSSSQMETITDEMKEVRLRLTNIEARQVEILKKIDYIVEKLG